MIRERNVMPAAKATKTIKTKKTAKTKTRLFHAKMMVTRLEEWCVEAETSEEARALLDAGAGHRYAPGESIQVELERLIDE